MKGSVLYVTLAHDDESQTQARIFVLSRKWLKIGKIKEHILSFIIHSANKSHHEHTKLLFWFAGFSSNLFKIFFLLI